MILVLSSSVGYTACGTNLQKKESSKENNRCERIIKVAKSVTHLDYGWGGDSLEDGSLDCSGYLFFIQKQIGEPIPRTTSRKMWILANGKSKHWSNSTCGDWTFFTFSPDRPKGHIGMITLNPEFYQSGSSTGPVKEKYIRDGFWDKKHVGTKSPKID